MGCLLRWQWETGITQMPTCWCWKVYLQNWVIYMVKMWINIPAPWFASGFVLGGGQTSGHVQRPKKLLKIVIHSESFPVRMVVFHGYVSFTKTSDYMAIGYNCCPDGWNQTFKMLTLGVISGIGGFHMGHLFSKNCRLPTSKHGGCMFIWGEPQEHYEQTQTMSISWTTAP